MATSARDVGWAAHADAIAHAFVTKLDDDLTIDGSDGHHLARVRRLRTGEHLTVADGRGTWRRYRVTDVTRDQLELVATDHLMHEPVLQPALAVAFALTKGEKPETVIARLTELGVDRIIPVMAARSVVRWDAERVASATDRFARVVHEAAMQSRRARRPEIEPVGPIDGLADRPGVVLADPAGAPIEGLPAPGPDGWTLVVGPEGGLTDDELEALGTAPRLTLGPHVLRAETAAVAGAALLTTARGAARSGPARGHGG